MTALTDFTNGGTQLTEVPGVVRAGVRQTETLMGEAGAHSSFVFVAFAASLTKSVALFSSVSFTASER